MTGTIKKRILSLLMALAVLMSGVLDFRNVNAVALEDESTAGDETSVTESEDTLTAPQNLRVNDDGYLVWDEVEDAYGYYLNYDENYIHRITYYVCTAEIDRMCYENNIDFGEHEFKVRAFKEDGTVSQWSEPVTAEYAPTLTAPSNVRLDEENEETVLWDRVDGAFRYNWRIYNDDTEHTSYTSSNSNEYRWLGESGDYWFSVQAMDKDYNVSEWTEPIKISHTQKAMLDTPQNVRFDETGENILWDEVAGANYYVVTFSSNKVIDGKYNWKHSSQSSGQAELKNWRAYVFPAADEYHISVSAYNTDNGTYSNYSSEELTVPSNFILDNMIELPETLTANSDVISFDTNSSIKAYWMVIYMNGKPLGTDYWYWFINYDHWDIDGYPTKKSNHIFDRYPEGNYEIKLFGVDDNNNYNVKTYPVTFDTPHDPAVWVPEVFYKFDTLLWDYDRVRHDTTDMFWVRVRNAKDGSIIELNCSGSEYYYGLRDLPNGLYILEACAYDYNIDKLGPWSTPREIRRHDDGLFDKENETTTEVEAPPEAADIPESDRITSITINPAFNMKHKDGDDVELDLSKITIKAKEIYDEEGLQRASEALGETISGNKHYNLLDLTLLYNEEDFSNGYEGLVQVVIPIPEGHRDKTFSCYRLTEVNGKMTKELIPGEQTEDSYIIYLEHFSEYALVGNANDDTHTHTYSSDWSSDDTNHWHAATCEHTDEVSDKAAHTFDNGVVTTPATTASAGVKTYTCTVCGKTKTESIPKLPGGSTTGGSSSGGSSSGGWSSGSSSSSGGSSVSTPAYFSVTNKTISGDKNAITDTARVNAKPGETAADNSGAAVKVAKSDSNVSYVKIDAPTSTNNAANWAEPIVKRADSSRLADVKKAAEEALKAVAYDKGFVLNIDVVNADRKTVEPGNNVEVTVPVPTAYKGKSLYAYRVTERGVVPILANTANNKITFNAGGAGEYIFTTEKLTNALTYEKGNVDLQGKANTNDATMILKHIVNLNTLKDEKLFIADVNGDGIVNTKDATEILRDVLGIA